MSNESERREFLKTAGLAALGGVAITSLGTGSAQAEPGAMGGAMMERAGKNHTVRIRCSRHVTVDNLVDALRKGIGEGGCFRCGLLGIELIFDQGDPAQNAMGRPIKVDIPNVNQMTFE